MPLFDQDSGLLVMAGMVRSRLMVSLLAFRNELNHELVWLKCISLSQGDTVVDCFEVSNTEPVLSQGKACSSVISQNHRFYNPLYCIFIFPLFPVSHCLTDTSTRGVAMVPKTSLDVMACEVIRVLQLTDSCIVPISYQVPRKV